MEFAESHCLLFHNTSLLRFLGKEKEILCAKERPPIPFHGAASQYDDYLVKLLLATKSLGILHLTKRDHTNCLLNSFSLGTSG